LLVDDTLMLGLSGLFAPIVTPLTDDGDSVSEIRLARVVRHLTNAGVDGFVVCTETGEFTTTNTGERKQMLELVLRESRGMPVLAHCTRLGTAQALDLCQHAGRHGARAAVIMPPYFGVYDDDEIAQHLRRISQHAGLPIIVVDPMHRVHNEMRQGLQTIPNLHFAQNLTAAFHARLATDQSAISSDEFAIEEAVVSPLIQIDPRGSMDPEADLTAIAGIVRQFGHARVAKAAYACRDIEVGPPRSPVLPLPHVYLDAIEKLVQTA
jgi:dihydrodipicolinate synthase/N-acetylneuraminate lyase